MRIHYNHTCTDIHKLCIMVALTKWIIAIPYTVTSITCFKPLTQQHAEKSLRPLVQLLLPLVHFWSLLWVYNTRVCQDLESLEQCVLAYLAACGCMVCQDSLSLSILFTHPQLLYFRFDLSGTPQLPGKIMTMMHN